MARRILPNLPAIAPQGSAADTRCRRLKAFLRVDTFLDIVMTNAPILDVSSSETKAAHRYQRWIGAGIGMSFTTLRGFWAVGIDKRRLISLENGCIREHVVRCHMFCAAESVE